MEYGWVYLLLLVVFITVFTGSRILAIFKEKGFTLRSPISKPTSRVKWDNATGTNMIRVDAELQDQNGNTLKVLENVPSGDNIFVANGDCPFANSYLVSVVVWRELDIVRVLYFENPSVPEPPPVEGLPF